MYCGVAVECPLWRAEHRSAGHNNNSATLEIHTDAN